MGNNSKLRAYPTDYINDPQRIKRIRRFCAVNGAAQVDLFGAVNAQMINEDWYSGVGGQVDFMRGAMRSKDGRAIIAMRATARVPDGRGGKKEVSRIVFPTDREPVTTTSMHDLQYVVTEHGVASLYGKSVTERAEALISVAAPQFRDGLRREFQRWRARSQQREQRRSEASRTR